MGLGTMLARAGLMVALRRWWARHAGARAFAYAALYPTFLVPAYLLPYLLVVELHGVAPGAALAAWDPMFLLLPVCLLAPYALTRAFAGERRWPARLSAAATVLGLTAALELAFLETSCGEPIEGKPWLELFCRTWAFGWGALATAAAMHLAAVIRGVGGISASASASEEEAAGREEAGREEAGREAPAGGAGPETDDGWAGGTRAKVGPASVWRRGAAWARAMARRGAEKAGSAASAAWRKTERPRAAVAAMGRTGKRRAAAAWRALTGAAEKRGGGTGPGGGGL